MNDSDPAGVAIHGTRVRRVTFYGRSKGTPLMTDEQRAAQIRALIEERRGYVERGQDDRVAQVDAELARLGAAGSAPAKRSEKRPATRRGESRS